MAMKRFDVEDGLFSTGQPSSEELDALAEEGVQTVINLRRDNEDSLPADWPEQVKAAGMTYVHMPIAGAPDITVENARALSRQLEDAKGPVVVHCGSANRVGALLALKAHYVDGKGAEDALEYGKAAGLTELEPRVKSLLDG